MTKEFRLGLLRVQFYSILLNAVHNSIIPFLCGIEDVFDVFPTVFRVFRESLKYYLLTFVIEVLKVFLDSVLAPRAVQTRFLYSFIFGEEFVLQSRDIRSDKGLSS